MGIDSAVVICRDALWLALTICAPILIAGVVVGFGIGLFQALTQIQEQTLAIVLKMVAMLLTFAWFFPWMAVKLVQFSRTLIENIPSGLFPF